MDTIAVLCPGRTIFPSRLHVTTDREAQLLRVGADEKLGAMATQSLGITNDRKRPGRQQSMAGAAGHTLNTWVLSTPLPPYNWADSGIGWPLVPLLEKRLHCYAWALEGN